jgi:hypothetical protein
MLRKLAVSLFAVTFAGFGAAGCKDNSGNGNYHVIDAASGGAGGGAAGAGGAAGGSAGTGGSGGAATDGGSGDGLPDGAPIDALDLDALTSG